MNDETDKFLDVTQAAEKMYEALSELKQRTGDYSEAGQRLESAAARTQALSDATVRMIEEQDRRWNELKHLLDEQVRPSLERLSDNADKQTVHLSSLSAAVAGQQSQLTLVQQSLSEYSQVLPEMRSSLAKLVQSSGEQARTLQKQSEELGRQQTALTEVSQRARSSTYAAAAAALLSLVALVVVIVYLVG
jgi:chromosome segregation ATPase